MKRLFLATAIAGVFASPAAAVIQDINYTSRTYWGLEAPKVQSNFVELYSTKSDKVMSVLVWDGWPDGTAFTTSSPPVWFDGQLYKCILAYTKITGEDPTILTSNFEPVIFGSSGGTASSAVEVSFTAAGTVESSNVQNAIVEVANEAQPRDSDLTAIAAIATTTYGRSLLDDANSTELRNSLGAEAYLGVPPVDGYVLASTAAGIRSWVAAGSGSGTVYPSVVGVPYFNGTGWGTSYTVGAAANNLVQLNASAQLPAVSAALLTSFPTLNQNTTGTSRDLDATGLASARTWTGIQTFEHLVMPNFDITSYNLQSADALCTAGVYGIYVSGAGWRTCTNGASAAIGSGGTGVSTLNDLSDVATTGATTGQVLTYNGSSWAPAPVSGSGTSGFITTPPTYSDSACVAGTHALDENYRYDCVASGNWKRTAITNWDNPAAPLISLVEIASNGTTLNVSGNKSLSVGAGGNGGVSIACTVGGAATAAYASGLPGVTAAYTLSKTISTGDTCVFDYVQPGNGLEATTGGLDVASINDQAITNSSTQGNLFGTKTFEFNMNAATSPQTPTVGVADSVTLLSTTALGTAGWLNVDASGEAVRMGSVLTNVNISKFMVRMKIKETSNRSAYAAILGSDPGTGIFFDRQNNDTRYRLVVGYNTLNNAITLPDLFDAAEHVVDICIDDTNNIAQIWVDNLTHTGSPNYEHTGEDFTVNSTGSSVFLFGNYQPLALTNQAGMEYDYVEIYDNF